jgi:hypothetical protein
MQSSPLTPFNPPNGRVIELAKKPSVLALLWALLPMGLFAISVPVIFLGVDASALPAALLGAFFVTLVLVGVVFSFIGRRRTVEYRLVLDPRGVFLVDKNGAVPGQLGVALLTLTPGHWLSSSRSGMRWNQCLVVGGWLSIGVYGAFPPYDAPVPTLARPQFSLRAEQWLELVRALPELRALSSGRV